MLKSQCCNSELLKNFQERKTLRDIGALGRLLKVESSLNLLRYFEFCRITNFVLIRTLRIGCPLIFNICDGASEVVYRKEEYFVLNH